MIATAIGCTGSVIPRIPATVEADVVSGLPQFTIVGLTDRAIQEARERVKAAVRNSGFKFPDHRVTVNLAPAEGPKEGTGFDLSTALYSPPYRSREEVSWPSRSKFCRPQRRRVA